MPDRVMVVGISPEGVSSLSPATSGRVSQAEILFGGQRLLGMFPGFTGEKVPIKNDLKAVTTIIKANLGRKRMVVLASGDPGLYGIARHLVEEVGKDRVEIFPGVSSMQLAFARIGESWEGASFVSVHARPIEEIVGTVLGSPKIGIFTDGRNTPARIARLLCEQGVGNCRAYVCQDVGTESESIVETDLNGLMDREFSPLNVVILLRDESRTGGDASPWPLIGIPDAAFSQPTPGHLITKQEVRAVSLAKLALSRDSVMWDIGAGSGAVSIEASFLARNGTVFAIEKNEKAVAVVRQNANRFGCHNVSVIHAIAPAGLDELPAPDAAFIGGSGGEMIKILENCCRRLRPGGHVVVNAATLETLQTATAALSHNGFGIEVTLVSVARSKAILDLTRLEALNPVFIIAGHREEEKA